MSLSVETTIEIACIELEQHVVMCVYRPPASSYDLFERIMDEALSKVCNNNKYIIVCGDFNIDLLEDSSLCNRIISLFRCYNLGYLFLEPTRITATTSTCLDNIYSNINPSSKSIINRLEPDHCGLLSTFDINKKNI